ncbi:Mediator of RNA polymerase II transcription subunit 13-like [Clydaea vesicula]|uniref:Mediator of RNA polymerase II transcription subunit 13 n=1 Tax=Clydaea vesicula TaxID=447962 RepID=A0AAD5XYE1_9FUNG|nr:Mediator of RNA polymerase II transcription subunit 13-like [Clydaea vesicula]
MEKEYSFSDSSLTNSFVISNVKSVVWKRYFYISKFELTSEENIPSNNINVKDPLLSTYLDLLEDGIPCLWKLGEYETGTSKNGKPTKLFSNLKNSKLRRKNSLHNISADDESSNTKSVPNHEEKIKPSSKRRSSHEEKRYTSKRKKTNALKTLSSNKSEDNISVIDGTLQYCRELWVFTYGNIKFEPKKYCNIKILHEIESGEFCDEQVNNNISESFVVSESCSFEYKLFCQALKNVLERPIIAVSLSIYYSTSNIIIQPSTTNIILRRLEIGDLDCDNTKIGSLLEEKSPKKGIICKCSSKINYELVLLSPHGIQAFLIPSLNENYKSSSGSLNKFFGYNFENKLLPDTVKVRINDIEGSGCTNSSIIMDYPSYLVYFMFESEDFQDLGDCYRKGYFPTSSFYSVLDQLSNNFNNWIWQQNILISKKTQSDNNTNTEAIKKEVHITDFWSYTAPDSSYSTLCLRECGVTDNIILKMEQKMAALKQSKSPQIKKLKITNLEESTTVSNVKEVNSNLSSHEKVTSIEKLPKEELHQSLTKEALNSSHHNDEMEFMPTTANSDVDLELGLTFHEGDVGDDDFDNFFDDNTVVLQNGDTAASKDTTSPIFSVTQQSPEINTPFVNTPHPATATPANQPQTPHLFHTPSHTPFATCLTPLPISPTAADSQQQQQQQTSSEFSPIVISEEEVLEPFSVKADEFNFKSCYSLNFSTLEISDNEFLEKDTSTILIPQKWSPFTFQQQSNESTKRISYCENSKVDQKIIPQLCFNKEHKDVCEYQVLEPLRFLKGKYGKGGKWKYSPKKKLSEKNCNLINTNSSVLELKKGGLELSTSECDKSVVPVAETSKKKPCIRVWRVDSTLFILNIPPWNEYGTHLNSSYPESNFFSMLCRNLQGLPLFEKAEDGNSTNSGDHLVDLMEEENEEGELIENEVVSFDNISMDTSLLNIIQPEWKRSSRETSTIWDKNFDLAIEIFQQQICFSFITIPDNKMCLKHDAFGKSEAKFDSFTKNGFPFSELGLQLFNKLYGIFDNALCKYDKRTSVNIKGPLTIQQYLDVPGLWISSILYNFFLDNDRNFSKYGGKVQLRKKKKSNEQVVELLSNPQLIFGHEGTLLKASPISLRFWEKLRLEPFGGKKHLQYLAVFPGSNPTNSSLKEEVGEAALDLSIEVANFFYELGTIYQTLQMGKHVPVESKRIEKGMVPVHLLESLQNEPPDSVRMRSYSRAMMDLGVAVTETFENTLAPDFLVIYVIDPFPHRFYSYFDLSYLCVKLLTSAAEAKLQIDHGSNQQLEIERSSLFWLHIAELKRKVIFQIIPIEAILERNAFSGHYPHAVKDICFTTYTRCMDSADNFSSSAPLLNRPIIPPLIYTPAFILSSPNLEIPLYTADEDIVNKTHLIMEPDRILHVAYRVENDWLCACWSDTCGELFESYTFKATSNTDCLKLLWEKTLKVSGVGGFKWRIVFGKYGLCDHKELQDWKSVLKSFIEQSSTTSKESQHEHIEYISSITVVSLTLNSCTKFFDYLPANTNISSSSDVLTPMDTSDLPGSPMVNGESSNSSVFKEQLMEDVPVSHSVVSLNHSVRIFGNEEKAKDDFKRFKYSECSSVPNLIPLVNGWIVDIPKRKDTSRETLLDSESIEVALLFHFQNPKVDSIRSVYPGWFAGSSINSSATGKSLSNLQQHSSSSINVSTANSTPTHFTNIMKDILKQFHYLRFLGITPHTFAKGFLEASSLTQLQSNTFFPVPYHFLIVERACKGLKCIPDRT